MDIHYYNVGKVLGKDSFENVFYSNTAFSNIYFLNFIDNKFRLLKHIILVIILFRIQLLLILDSWC